ncbi:MAG: glycosyltransferase family 2 protein [Lentimicrobiaceae bacterium]|nr:glycosyltransferase family 2 protein [Lentimicrobiaceae bacterium]
MRVAVVILNWNGEKFLREFFQQVVNCSPPDTDIIIADNGSTDGSIGYIRKAFPKVRIIDNKRNTGFASGYNRALKLVDADYYVLLNNDILVTPGWIPPVIKLMESDPKIAACQPKLRSYTERDQFEYAGAAGGFIDRLGYPFCRGRIFQSIEEDHGQYDDPREIFWATGACMFIRAELYHRFGGFDDDFFAHMEEIDLCWRLKNLNYRIMYCPESIVYHVGGGSLPKKSSFKTYLNIRNNIIMLYKNLPDPRRKRVLFIRFFMDILASFKFLIDGGVKDFWAVFRAYAAFYSTMKRSRRKRSGLIQSRSSQIYRGYVVFDHYIRRKKRFSELDREFT